MKSCDTCLHYKDEKCYFREVDENNNQVTGTAQNVSDYPCSECENNYLIRNMWEKRS